MRWRSDEQPAGGFTLLEIMAVIVVLGLALALILANMRRPSPAVALSMAAGQVQGALRLARSEAIAADRPIGVTFDPGTGTLRIDGAAAVRLPSGAAIVAGAGGGMLRISFAPDGSGAGGPILLSAGERREAIQVDWLSGRIRTGDEESAR